MPGSCPRCGIDHSAGSTDCPAARLGALLGGKYRLEKILGVGGFGAVYRATHEPLGRAFAVKVLLAPLARRPEIAERFLREARVVAALDHEGIVRVTDYGTGPDGAPYLVMDLLVGRTARERVRAEGRGLPVEEAIEIGRRALAALAAAHRRGVVHRDIKPENLLLLDGVGGLRLLDFGLAKILESADGLTRSAEYMGTPQYSSPEQIETFGRVDARGDVYSMGAVLFHLLTGEPPVHGGDTLEVAMRVMRGEVERRPRRIVAGVPEWLDALVARAMAPSPEDRFPSAVEMLAALVSGAGGTEGAAALTERVEPSSTGRPGPEVGSGKGPLSRTFAGAGRHWTGILVVVVAAAIAALIWQRFRDAQSEEAGDRSDPVARNGAIRLERIEIRMGSTSGEVRAAFAWCRELAGSDCREELYGREMPQRQVALAAFDVDRTEVSNAAFATWLASLPEIEIGDGRVRSGGVLLADLRGDGGGLEESGGVVSAIAGRERWPVVQVTWRAARDYCRAGGGDLPTEAQWERAARGDSGRQFPWGDDRPKCEGVAFGRGPGAGCDAARRGPEAVDAPNADITPDGVLHLGGNVSEWVRDGFVAPYPPCAEPCHDPYVESAGTRVVRGGNWGGLAEMTRAAGRGRADEATTSTQIGFRCVGEAT